jgi:hypothetical protein
VVYSGRSVGIVRSRTKGHGVCLFVCAIQYSSAQAITFCPVPVRDASRERRVTVAAGYGMEGPGSIPTAYRPALWPTHPPIQWVPRLFTRYQSGQGVKLTITEVKNAWSYATTMACLHDSGIPSPLIMDAFGSNAVHDNYHNDRVSSWSSLDPLDALLARPLPSDAFPCIANFSSHCPVLYILPAEQASSRCPPCRLASLSRISHLRWV